MNVDAMLARAATVLDVDRVGLDDDFFTLGGDSLAALELAEVLSEALDRPVDVRDIVAAETFRDLFARLEAG